MPSTFHAWIPAGADLWVKRNIPGMNRSAIIRWFRSPGLTREIIASGRVSVCRPKPNGRKPRGPMGAFFLGDEPANDRLANFDDKIHKTTPVGSYLAGASPYGLQDMAGNVWEWVDDWYSLDYYRTSIRENPPGPDSGDRKVLRGGSWFSITDIILKTHIRKKRPPEIRDYGTGFRCAFSAE